MLKPSLKKLHWVDWLLLGLSAAFVLFVLWRIQGQLNYNWSWQLVRDFVYWHDESTGESGAGLLLIGLATTIRLSIWSGLLALVLGILIALARTSKVPLLRMLGRTYVELLRNVPPVVLVFIFFFFLAEQLMPVLGVEEAVRSIPRGERGTMEFLFGETRYIPSFIAGVIVLALFESSFVAEIIRAGIDSVGRGQWEAADSIGLTTFDKMRFVVLPQAMQKVLPPLAGQFISLVKDSSIISLISVQELTYKTIEMVTSTHTIFEAWIATALCYFLICYLLSLLFSRLEKKRHV